MESIGIATCLHEAQIGASAIQGYRASERERLSERERARERREGERVSDS